MNGVQEAESSNLSTQTKKAREIGLFSMRSFWGMVKNIFLLLTLLLTKKISYNLQKRY